MKAALRAGAVVALADLWALRHAWGSLGERLAIALGVTALAVGGALALTPWLLALARVGRWRAAAAAGAGMLVGLPLAATPGAHARLGALAALALPAAVALALATLPMVGRAAAGAIGLTNLTLLLALPRRLYPSLRVALMLFAFAALMLALRRRGDAATGWPRRLALAALLLGAGRWLVDRSANTRFVASAQAPVAGPLLDVVTMVEPFRSMVEPFAPMVEPFPQPTVSPAVTRARLAHAPLDDAHLVLVTVDALRADRLPRMPALAALAARGVRFERAYATAPSTAASITSLLTGHHPSHLGGRPPSLQEQVRAAGWLTAAFYPAGLFFDGGGALRPYAEGRFGAAWADTRTLSAGALTDAALERVHAIVDAGEPRSFLWLHYFDPHEPYELHGLPAGASDVERYDAEVRAVDDALARLVGGLQRLARPTLLVVTADHGEEFGEHGGAYHGSSLYDEQLRVPLVLVALGRQLSPEVVTAPVSLVALAPTLAALLGLPPPGGDGHDLADAIPPRLFAAVHTRRLVRQGDWKLIRDLRRDVDELYDLAADPAEQRNLIDARPAVAAELQGALAQWLNQSPAAQLAAVLADGSRPAHTRAAAARELGAREAYTGAAALRAALADAEPAVRAEAALALAQLTDHRAQPALRALLDEPRYADRAAVMLGRLRDALAAPRLRAICRRAAVRDGDEAALRRDAAHYLGFVGGAGDVDALFAAAADPRLRGSAYVAVGRIAARTGDVRASARLRAQLAVEDRADARAELAGALDGLAARH